MFESPKGLNLRLLCTSAEDARCLASVAYCRFVIRQHVNNIIDALKQRNRVCKIDFQGISSSLLKAFSETKEPFPALTVLQLVSHDPSAPVLSDSFLVGSAPRLRNLHLFGIPFPTLPKLLSSTRDLVKLNLRNIPHSGYFPPDEMVTALSTLTRLKELHIIFQSPQSWADQAGQRPTRFTRASLPVLSSFYFKGDSKYLEDIVAQIDTPPLENVSISFFDPLVLNTPRLRHFLNRPEAFTAFNHAVAVFYDDDVMVQLFPPRKGVAGRQVRMLEMLCREPEQQLLSLGQTVNLSLPPRALSTLEHLEIRHCRQHWQDDIRVENSLWLELLTPIFLRERSGTGRPTCTNYRTRPAGAPGNTSVTLSPVSHRGKSDRDVTRARKSSLKAVRAIGTNPGCHCAVRHCPTALWTAFGCPPRGSNALVVNV